MNELSLYILDILQNSIKAKASNILLDITDNDKYIFIKIIDDGIGFSVSQETLFNPFYTTSSKKVGLGLPLFKEICENTGGYLNIQSLNNTILEAKLFKNINFLSIGSIEDTILTMLLTKDFRFIFKYNDEIIVDSNNIHFKTIEEFKEFIKNKIKNTN